MKSTIRLIAGVLILLISLSVCLSGSVLAADFSFTLTSDVQGATAAGQYPAVLDDITATGGPGVFMVYPGDHYPPTNGGVDACLENAYGSSFVWYPIVGNHELDDPAYMQWTRDQYYGLPYIVNSGPPNCVTTTYSFDYGNAHFVAINEYYNGSSDVGTDGDVVTALYNWLAADLAATTKKWIFLIGHEPAYPQCDVNYPTECRHIGDSLDQYPANRDAFWALLDAHDVVAYFCGHTHRYYRYQKDNVWEVNSAQARGTGLYDTYIRVIVGDDTVTFDTYRSLNRGYFTKTDTWSVYRPSTPITPIIAEVSPDPASAVETMEYVRQLTLTQGYPSPSWSVIEGPTGLTVNGNGQVSGWTPSSGEIGNTYPVTIRATNSQGTDDESWYVRVDPLPADTVATFPFAAGAEGWALATWKSGTNADGSIIWTSYGGHPGGCLHSTGGGESNGNESCTREGGMATRQISTENYTDIRVEYDVVAIVHIPHDLGCLGGCLATVLEGSCEDKLVVFYSTTGTAGPWVAAQSLVQEIDLPGSWTHKTIDLTGVPAVENNPNFALRFQWQFNIGDDSGRIDNITVKGTNTVNSVPQVDAGQDQTFRLPKTATLNGTVTDDGRPNPPGAVIVHWSKFVGPGTVTFTNPTMEDTAASFSQAGVYVLALTADDSALSSTDHVTITVNPILVPDYDADDDVDLEDFGFLQRCYSGTNIPYSTGCQQADLDEDNDVDQTDFGLFKNCMRGTNNLPGC